MKLSHTFISLVLFFVGSGTSEVPRPRGVSLSRAALYNPTQDFKCLDNSLSIPFSQVNDDYCDCPDASDEPGTAACPLGTFHCTNAGHKPMNIHSSRVNDGVCDCCDGSDEYVSGRCVNNCKELGRTAREEAQRRAELVRAGKEIKQDMSEKGAQMRQERKEKLSELQKQREEAETMLKQKEDIKKAIEERESLALEQYRQIEEENKKKREQQEAENTRAEAAETFKKFDSNQDNILDISELKTRQTFDKDRNGEVTDDEAKYFLNDRESVDLETFISDAWQLIKPYLMMEAGMFKPPAGQGSVEEVPLDRNNEFEEPQVHEDEEEEEQPAEDEEELDEEEDGEHHHEEGEEHQEEEANSDIVYDEETQKLVNEASRIRKEYTEAEQAVRNFKTEITNIEEYLQKDFGPDNSFAPLVGNCFDYQDYEYIYRLCPFDKATQQSKSGASDTRLGTWAKWTGPEHNKYESMLYDHGQSCWNGPQRSTLIKLTCGGESKVTAVSEPNRCEYMFEFSTPAACFDMQEEHKEDRHDEL